MVEKCQDIFPSNTSVFTVPELKISTFPRQQPRTMMAKRSTFLCMTEKNFVQKWIWAMVWSSLAMRNLELLSSLRPFSQLVSSLGIQWKVQKIGSWNDMDDLVKKRYHNSTDCSKVRQAGRVYLKWYNLWNIIFHFLILKENFCF